MELEELKKNYTVYEKKYKLPSFKELNFNFEIEKIDRDTDIFLKVVRSVMMEKIISTQRFLETIVTPGNTPRMLFSFLKSMNQEDKKNIDSLYDQMSSIISGALDLDIEFNEAKEAEMIKKIYSSWVEMKKPLLILIKKMQNPQGQGSKKERTYFG